MPEGARGALRHARVGRGRVIELRECAIRAGDALARAGTMTPEVQRLYAQVCAIFETRYRDEYFVDVLPPGTHPETRSVRGANHCRLAVHRPQQGDTVVVLSVIDNLVKGAAGQAIQNMNVMFGLSEQTGLANIALLP